MARGAARGYNQTMRAAFVLSLLSTCIAFANDAGERAQAAAAVMREIMGTKDRAIPQDLLDKAHCAVIIPGLTSSDRSRRMRMSP